MYTLFDAELWDENVKRGVEDTNNFGLADDGAVALREIRDEDTQEQVVRLLLCELGRVPLTVEHISA